MKITRHTARLGLSVVTAAAIVLGAGVSGASAASAPHGPGRSGEAHAEHGHPNPDAVRGHDEEGKRGKGHESHGNGHGYGHGDHHGGEEIVIIDEPAADQPNVDQPKVDQPNTDQPKVEQPAQDEPNVDQNIADRDAPRDGNPVAQIQPEVGPSVVNTPVAAPASQAKSLDPVADTDDSFAPAIAPVELRSNVGSSVESGSVSVSSVNLDGSTDGVILRFR